MTYSLCTRYQLIKDRKRATELPWTEHFRSNVKAAKWSSNGKAGVSWKGVRLLKDPFSLSLYSSLLWELKPRTIIEMGAFEGGSALWLADIACALGIDSEVIGYDIVPPRVETANRKVKFRELDLMLIQDHFDKEELMGLPRPLLLIEDAHVNLAQVLPALYSIMSYGDYLVVEDTCDLHKHDELTRFLSNPDVELFVDSHYTDNFGYNGSWNWNSFLTKRPTSNHQP